MPDTPQGARTNVLALSGNSVIVRLNGVVCGFINNITGTDDYAPDALSGIGDIHVAEHVPTQARYSIAVDRMCLRTSSLMTVAGGQADNVQGSQGNGGQGSASGTANGRGYWEDGYAVLQGYVFDIEVVAGSYQIPANELPDAPQVQAGKTFKKWIGCSFATGSTRISRHAIVIEDATFLALQVDGMHTVA